MKLAVKVRMNGDAEVMDISGDTLKALQSAVGGNVEAVDMKWGLTVWCDEEGKLKSYPVNNFATMLYWETYAVTSEEYENGVDLIVGDVVITKYCDKNGDIPSMPEGLVDDLLKHAGNYKKRMNKKKLDDRV